MDGNSSRLKSRFLEGIPSQAKPNGIRRKTSPERWLAERWMALQVHRIIQERTRETLKLKRRVGPTPNHRHRHTPPSNCISMCIHLFAFAPDLTLVCLMVWVGLVMWCALSPIHPPLASQLLPAHEHLPTSMHALPLAQCQQRVMVVVEQTRSNDLWKWNQMSKEGVITVPF